jgi:hypothetical protein
MSQQSNSKSEQLTLSKFIDNYIEQSVINITKQSTIFISIGSAANLLYKGLFKLNEKDDHQFPPFIKLLKTSYPTIPLHIVLIDPELENPPNCIFNSSNSLNTSYSISNISRMLNINRYLPEGWKKDTVYDNVYYNTLQQIYVYGIKSTFDRDDLTKDMFIKLNNHIISTNDLLLVHDFTGDGIVDMAFLFDQMLEGVKDRIIYDITLRSEPLCYVDLTNKLYFLDFNLTIPDNIIKIKNPYNVHISQFINEYTTCININDNLYKTQLVQSMVYRIKYFFEVLFTTYRQIYNLALDIKNINLVYLIKQLKIFKSYYGYDMESNFLDAYNKKNMSSIITFLKDIIKINLSNILTICFKEDAKYKIIIEKLINDMDNNIYYWEQHVKNTIINELVDNNVIITDYFM